MHDFANNLLDEAALGTKVANYKYLCGLLQVASDKKYTNPPIATATL